MRNNQGVSSALLVLLCDIKTGGNDTIEVTVVSFVFLKIYIFFTEQILIKYFFSLKSSPTRGAVGVLAVSEAVKLLGELLSRSNLDENYSIDNAEAAHLAAILEIKVSINY